MPITPNKQTRRRALCEHAENNTTPSWNMHPHQCSDGISWSGTALSAGSWDTPPGGTALDETRPLSHRQSLSVHPCETPSPTLKGTPIRPLDGHIKVTQVVFMRCSRNPRSRVCDKTLSFLAMCIHTHGKCTRSAVRVTRHHADDDYLDDSLDRPSTDVSSP